MRTHRPTFPQYPLPETPVSKKLAWIENSKIYTQKDEYGNARVYHFDDFDDLFNIAFRNNLQLHTSSLLNEKFLPLVYSMVQYPTAAKVCCTQLGIPFLIRLHNRDNRSAWICTADTWHTVPAYESLERLSQIFDFIGLGVSHTPATLGTRTMMYCYELNEFGKHSSPSLGVENYLRQHAVGGIVQAPGKGFTYEETTQLDMASAYLSQYSKHPDGSAGYFDGGRPTSYVTYFCECIVRINKKLPLGVFPVRGDNRYTVAYPTEPGTYNAYLWREQIEDAELVGCDVEVLRGYGWRKWTYHNYPWSQYAYFKRKEAARISKELEQDVKRVTNGAMGKFGINRQQYYLVSDSERRSGDRGTHENGIPLSFFVREETNHGIPIMLHWEKYTIMQTNRVVYLFALPFAKQGRLVWMDYDSVMVIEDSVKGMYIKKYDPRTLFIQPGTWIWSLWYNITIAHKGDRSFKGFKETGEFIDHSPGIPEEDKEVA